MFQIHVTVRKVSVAVLKMITVSSVDRVHHLSDEAKGTELGFVLLVDLQHLEVLGSHSMPVPSYFLLCLRFTVSFVGRGDNECLYFVRILTRQILSVVLGLLYIGEQLISVM